ncbi:unnamed protein product [Fraxinus pennsylvanica]|uniref:Uncharacterized protein n=1 Tax=Fraxinus pennsylvanica TaxID=56036 RepID=A0AAD1YT09_9LAMI|nr:unnamed protein product [Fraxinus pennsylvanica]
MLPVTVFQPMHYLTFASPRTTEPALCIAACKLMGGDRGHAMAAASAIHLMPRRIIMSTCQSRAGPVTYPKSNTNSSPVLSLLHEMSWFHLGWSFCPGPWTWPKITTRIISYGLLSK